MKNILLIIVVFSSFSCLQTKLVDKHVKRYYLDNSRTTHLGLLDSTGFKINYVSKKPLDEFCKTKKDRYIIVPLIVYFYNKQKLTADLNENIQVNYFISYFKNLLAVTSNLGNLKNQTIEVWFNEIPHEFQYEYTLHSVNFLAISVPLALNFRNYKIKSKPQTLSVNFKIKDAEGNVVKEGQLIENVKSTEMKGNFYLSFKRIVNANIVDYDFEVQSAMKSIASSIIKELE